MNIRSVTLLAPPTIDPSQVKAFFQDAKSTFPIPVQTTRLALPPFPDWWPVEVSAPETAATLSTQLTQQWQAQGADYLSVGPVQLRHDAAWLQHIPYLIAGSDALFATAEIADNAGHIDLGRCQLVAGVIQQLSGLHGHGFGNLYFTALANCRAGAPFFPVAYHETGQPARFALAIEAADLAVDAFTAATTLAEAKEKLIQSIERESARLLPAANALAERYALPFAGLDFSLAPYPTVAQSLGQAMELLGLPYVGAAGSLFAAAFITNTIGEANFPRCGFSGLMLPVLEDAILAQRAASGVLSLHDLLSYGAVCGVGLDTIPLPGESSVAQLTAILLDVAALATRLQKPLTARLMPLPQKKVGDAVSFDFPYFADSGVMSIAGTGVQGLMNQAAVTQMKPYQQQERANE